MRYSGKPAWHAARRAHRSPGLWRQTATSTSRVERQAYSACHQSPRRHADEPPQHVLILQDQDMLHTCRRPSLVSPVCPNSVAPGAGPVPRRMGRVFVWVVSIVGVAVAAVDSVAVAAVDSVLGEVVVVTTVM